MTLTGVFHSVRGWRSPCQSRDTVPCHLGGSHQSTCGCAAAAFQTKIWPANSKHARLAWKFNSPVYVVVAPGLYIVRVVAIFCHTDCACGTSRPAGLQENLKKWCVYDEAKMQQVDSLYKMHPFYSCNLGTTSIALEEYNNCNWTWTSCNSDRPGCNWDRSGCNSNQICCNWTRSSCN